ncbi:unnamed protein product [Effrenium voratum]|uniref:Uncharacterized protein n=1 Tax=Effrenium voratum TaxID=2562239 RepID=A0AA36HLW5_9DINO|nr:unnamed protein product [Effrenium voratum]CAJ1424949.1 unnamed protein product [Effrenium voratum]
MTRAWLKGKVCVVTGGASGIGAALCRRFAAEGAKVVVADMAEDAARAVAAAIDGVAVRCNVAQEMDIRRLIAIAEAQGPIEVFAANAGIPSNGGEEVPNDEWERIMGVNVMQHIYTARHLFPLWLNRPGEKHLMITASAAGLLTQVGSLPYSVTKHAALATAEWFRITYASSGIRVCCLCPQAVETGMVPSDSGGSVAGIDGLLKPEKVAEDVLLAMEKGHFLVLPHAEVLKYFQRKASDYDRWLAGMERLQKAFGEMVRRSPPISAAKL